PCPTTSGASAAAGCSTWRPSTAAKCGRPCAATWAPCGSRACGPPPQLAAEAAHVLERGEPLFCHVVVDESQDLHPTQWRMLRAAVPEGPDDLFVVGDPHQRVSDDRVSLASLGIDVRGRGHRLRVGYRLTQETLDWAMPILDHRTDPGTDDGADSPAGLRSVLHGPAPVVRE